LIMNKSVIIIGGGGHAKVLADILQLMGNQIIGAVDPQSMNIIPGVRIIGDDEVVTAYDPSNILLVNGVGSTQSTAKREGIYSRYKSLGYRFTNVIHPTAVVACGVILGEGVQIMAGAIIQPGCEIGNNTIINTKASVDHDCIIGSHVHIAPGATLSGGIIVEDGVHIGTGAVIIERRKIGASSMIAAGAVVVNDVRPDTIMVGVPAKEAFR
jgi:sugar O-acyltransferase (sialic acid O-acetyltransferase NeuD family)